MTPARAYTIRHPDGRPVAEVLWGDFAYPVLTRAYTDGAVNTPEREPSWLRAVGRAQVWARDEWGLDVHEPDDATRGGNPRGPFTYEEHMPRPLVIIESPYAGDVERNLRYLRACLRDSLMRGEAPFASHALYTQPGVLDDAVTEERELGMEAGFEWGDSADKVAMYLDLGVSNGMLRGQARAHAIGQPVEHRYIGMAWDPLVAVRDITEGR